MAGGKDAVGESLDPVSKRRRAVVASDLRVLTLQLPHQQDSGLGLLRRHVCAPGLCGRAGRSVNAEGTEYCERSRGRIVHERIGRMSSRRNLNGERSSLDDATR